MTTITMRHTKGAFLVTGKDIEARRSAHVERPRTGAPVITPALQ